VSSGNFLVQGSTCEFCWLTNTKWPSLHLRQPPSTTWTTSIMNKISTFVGDSLCYRVLLLPHTPFSHSNVVHLRATWLVPTLPQLCDHPTLLPMPSSGNSTRNWCHWIENASLMTLQYFCHCKRGISTGNLKLYTIDCSKYCANNKCNTIRIVPRSHKHPSSGANRPSDVAVTVNIDAEFNLSLIWTQLTTELLDVPWILSPSIVRD